MSSLTISQDRHDQSRSVKLSEADLWLVQVFQVVYSATMRGAHFCNAGTRSCATSRIDIHIHIHIHIQGNTCQRVLCNPVRYCAILSDDIRFYAVRAYLQYLPGGTWQVRVARIALSSGNSTFAIRPLICKRAHSV
jgi:hypothetical protein